LDISGKTYRTLTNILEVANKPPSGNDSALDLLFIGHMDTVFEQGTAAARPFSRDAKRAYGPGVCDMKGGLATMLHIAEILQQTAGAEDIAIAMAFNSDEEIGCAHSEDEYIELDSILPNMHLMFEIVKAVADGRIS
jgi:glutamate carboxypeptidase